jgi:hypothetical protein
VILSRKNIILLISFFSVGLLSSSSFALNCKGVLRDLPNRYRRVLNLTEAERQALSTGEMRYFEELRQINGTLQTDTADPNLEIVIDNVRNKDMRVQAFRMDAGIRSMADAFDGTRYEKVLKAAQKVGTGLRFETGVFTDTQDIAKDIQLAEENAKKTGKPFRLPVAFRTEADRQVKKGRKAYEKFLKDNGWVGSDRKSPKLLEAAISIMSTLSEREQLEVFKDYVTDYIKKTADKSFDMNDLEGGIHPLRRHLRWIAIMIQSLNTFELFDPAGSKIYPRGTYRPKTESDLGHGTTDNPAIAKYAVLINRGQNPSPILVNKAVYEYLTMMIYEFGLCKEVGQRIDRFADIFLKSGEAKNEKEALKKAEKLASLHPVYFDFRARAQQLDDDLEASGVLQELSSQILAAIDARLEQIPK